MNSREYIESGLVELYVFGKLSEEEKQHAQQMAADNPAIRTEIAAIEQALIHLSQCISPTISSETYDKLRLEVLKSNPITIEKKTKPNWLGYSGWAFAILLLLGAALLYFQMNNEINKAVNIEIAKNKSEYEKLQNTIQKLEVKSQSTYSLLKILRDPNNTVIKLEGQNAMPFATAKVYWNKATQAVYIDAQGLPQPPQGMVYQVWALKMDPLTPTSIGLLDNATAETTKMYKIDNTTEAEAFGITLEPEGGSAVPTMEQLYTLGKV
jgi:anti-sigma-K factor RskA